MADAIRMNEARRDLAVRHAQRRRQVELGRRGGRSRETSGASVGYVGRERVENVQAKLVAIDRLPAIAHMFPGSGYDTPEYAILHWFTQKIVTHLVQPGMYRHGKGGQSDAEWSLRAVSDNDFAREAGRHGQPYISRPALVLPERQIDTEQHDPFAIGAKHARGPSTRLYKAIFRIVDHLKLPVNNVIAAAWYVSRLGLHECDPKGNELRELLRASCKGYKHDAVEMRVAFLGLWLANRYIEDDCWALKFFAQAFDIDLAELRMLEFAATKDMLFSLKFDHEEWVEHLRESMHDIVEPAPIVFSVDLQNVETLNACLEETFALEAARVAEKNVPAEVRAPELTTPRPAPSRLPLSVLPAYSSVPPREAIADDDDEDEYCEYDGAKPFITRADLRRASASAEQPLAGIEVAVDNVADDEDEYCEYDGAKPFITKADLRRASDTQRSPMQSWLNGVSQNHWQAVPVDAPPVRLRRVRSHSFRYRNEPVDTKDEDYGMDEQDAEDVYRSLAPHYPYMGEGASSVGMHPTTSTETFQTIDSSEALGARTPEYFGFGHEYEEEEYANMPSSAAQVNSAVEAVAPAAMEAEVGNTSIDDVEALMQAERAAWSNADLQQLVLEPGVQIVRPPTAATRWGYGYKEASSYAYDCQNQYQFQQQQQQQQQQQPWSFD